MAFIRTVLGDTPATQLGVCYAHEHLIIDPSFTTHKVPDFLLDDVTAGIAELRLFTAAGGKALVDSMPCDSGRNVVKLAALATAAKVHIVVPTGLHLAKYYDSGHWGNFYTEEELAALFIAEITQGIDAHDYNGPLVKRTPHRAGVLKIATDSTWTAREEKVFAAAAQAHRETGCPILTHCEQGKLGLEQVRKLADLGVSLRHVCLSHTDRQVEVSYHRDLLQTGVRLEYDSAFRRPREGGTPTRDLLLALIDEFPDSLMLGMDAARRGYWVNYGGGPGLAYLLTTFSQELRQHGLTDEQWHRLFVTTPADTYAFVK